jgi:dTDP-4-dehydrorhamnose 3,5-epimerase
MSPGELAGHDRVWPHVLAQILARCVGPVCDAAPSRASDQGSPGRNESGTDTRELGNEICAHKVLVASRAMDVRQLSVTGAWEFTPRVFGDDRGAFLEWFKAPEFAAAVGHQFTIAQANHSISRRGVVRGVHFAMVPPSQGKYVYCPKGAVLDIIVDIRVGSPTFGQSDSVRLDGIDRRAVYLAEGLGHAFIALEDDAMVTYLCSTGYNPAREFGINPLDPALQLSWPAGIEPILSDKDRDAPTLAEAHEQGLLPRYDDCLAFYQSLRR